MEVNVLVTGANGQLGRSIKKQENQWPSLKFIYTDSKTLDITNPNAVTAFFKKHTIAYCINCAAYTAVDQAEKDQDQAFKINALGPKYLALACKAGNAVLIHISTDFVFDGSKTSPYTENDTPQPINVYGQTKLQGEDFIAQTTERYFIVRTSWLYSEYGHNFVKTMLRLSKTRSEINVVNDQVGSPTYAGDLATAVLKIIDSKTTQYGLYHYSNTGETSWYGFAKTIFKLAGIDVKLNPITSAQYPTLAKRPKYSVLKNDKLLEQFNIKAPRWESSLKKTLGGLTEHNQG